MGEGLSRLADRELVALVSAASGVPREVGRELLRRLKARGGAPSPASLRCSAEAWEAFGRRMGAGRRERFWVVALDARNRPVRRHLVALGTLDHCVVHPRDVFGPLVRGGAAACLLVHNHPSGDPTPSVEDEVLTRRLIDCGRLLGVPVLDHLVVARGGYVSLRDRGLGGWGSDLTGVGGGSKVGESGARGSDRRAGAVGRNAGGRRRRNSVDEVRKALLDALRKAIEAEHEGYGFYQMASQATQDGRGREVFQRLGQEELAHAAFLKAQYRSILETGRVDAGAALGRPQGMVGGIFSPALRARIGEAHFEMSALGVGIHLEQSAMEFYSAQAARAADPAVRRFFQELSEWEAGHFRALSEQQEELRGEYWSKNGFAPF